MFTELAYNWKTITIWNHFDLTETCWRSSCQKFWMTLFPSSGYSQALWTRLTCLQNGTSVLCTKRVSARVCFPPLVTPQTLCYPSSSPQTSLFNTGSSVAVPFCVSWTTEVNGQASLLFLLCPERWRVEGTMNSMNIHIHFMKGDGARNLQILIRLSVLTSKNAEEFFPQLLLNWNKHKLEPISAWTCLIEALHRLLLF